MTDKEWKSLAIKTAVFSVIAIVVCIVRAATKPIIIEGTAEARESARGQIDDEPLDSMYDALVLDMDELESPADGADLIVPLPAGISSEDVRTENHYLSHQLWIVMRSSRADYSGDDFRVSAVPEKVREGVYLRVERSECSLRFGLTGLYEPVTSLEDGALRIKLVSPGEVYEHVLLIDPGETDGESDIPLMVANEAARRLSAREGIMVYVTRAGEHRDEDLSITMLRETGADLCISLSVDKSLNSAISAQYNETWYLRNYSNARFAADLLEGVAGATGYVMISSDGVGRSEPFLAASTVPTAALILPDTDGTDASVAAAGIEAAVLKARGLDGK
ncbi:MAG: hypothetical protein K6C95_01575 [Lachnospiraceae bacterium]|nr:hypothetical protein [Lachnospiraceae bacterium]